MVENLGRAAVEAVGIDLDGVLYLGGQAVPGAVRALAELRRAGLKILLVTNNSARTRAEIREKLRGMDLDVAEEAIISSAWVTARHLAHGGARDVAVIGSASLGREMRDAGLSVADDSRAQYLVVGYKPDFSYADVERACRILEGGAEFIACNLERQYPVAGGLLLPGCGPGVMAIAHAAAHPPDGVMGKPSRLFLDAALAAAGVAAERFLVIGDSWESDVAMALAAGCPAVHITAEDRPAGHSGVGRHPSMEDFVEKWLA